MGSLARFSLFRLGLLAAALVVFRLLGARGILLVLLATGAALALSYTVLSRSREEAALWLASRAKGRRSRGFGRGLAEDAAAEDAEAEAEPRENRDGRPGTADRAQRRQSRAGSANDRPSRLP